MPNIEISGPHLPEYYISVCGFRVPYITLQPRPDDRWDVIVDHRFGLWSSVSFDELDNWMPVIAHAMAVAAGFSSHGEDSRPMNRFHGRVTSLGEMRPDGEKPKLEIVRTDGET